MQHFGAAVVKPVFIDPSKQYNTKKCTNISTIGWIKIIVQN